MEAQPAYCIERAPGNSPAYRILRAYEKLARTHYVYLHRSGLCVKDHKCVINFIFLQTGSELN